MCCPKLRLFSSYLRQNENHLRDFGFKGSDAFSHILATSEYRDKLQTIASLTLFSHPQTVQQTNNQNLFRVIRCRSISDRGTYSDYTDSGQVMLDDNMAAIETFNWSNGIRRCSDCQYNHIWPDSQNASLYTNLANICVSPAFLAKLTDTDKDVCDLLRYRAFELYNGFSPTDITPAKPDGYDNLLWAEPRCRLSETLKNSFETKCDGNALTGLFGALARSAGCIAVTSLTRSFKLEHCPTPTQSYSAAWMKCHKRPGSRRGLRK